MLTYHNDPAIKAALVTECRRHYETDMLIKGTYGGDCEGTKLMACSIGCLWGPDAGDRVQGALEAGIFPIVRQFADDMFERLPEPDNLEWHLQWPAAIPVGASEAQINAVIDKLQLIPLRQRSEDECDAHYRALRDEYITLMQAVRHD